LTLPKVEFEVIGYVHNGREDATDTHWDIESTIVLDPRFADGLLGLEEFSHAIIVFHMHRADSEPPTLRRRPRLREDMPFVGVFAARGRMRPNAIGITSVEVLKVESDRVTVRALDAIEGTPVLDIKPYVPALDRRNATVPEWADRLLQNYF
jgi:tRNA (adenine37-N6)-methyltransferase